MAGASLAHNALVANLVAFLHEQLRRRPCQVFPSDMRVRTRQQDGRWILSEAGRLEDTMELRSIGCHLALADLYEKVDLTAPDSLRSESKVRTSEDAYPTT